MNTIEMTRFKPLSYACTEAINSLCTNLTFAGSDKKVIMITSAQPHEGKSFISMNLLRTYASLGKRVVLVDADLRRSQLISRYGLQVGGVQHMGLSHYLAGMCSMEEILYQTNLQNAYMVPLTREVSNSLSLLNNNRMGKLLSFLRERFDYVIVDAPPVGVIIDAVEIAKHCDGVIVAVKYNSVSRRELNETKRRIELTGCPILGVVLNSVSFEMLSSKRYYHKSYYTHYDSDYYKPTRKASRSSK